MIQSCIALAVTKVPGRYCFRDTGTLIRGWNSGNNRRMSEVGETIEQTLAEIRFDRDGLVPAIAQQYDSGEILMVAWMNREAVHTTLTDGRVCYWSRSRAKLWRKGETSGQVQLLRELRLDCDGDTLLLLVDQHGVACHTGRRSCFFRAWRAGGWTVIAEPQIDPATLYPESAAEPIAAAGRTDVPGAGPSSRS
jgi:phosphoribosyl-AMP cyclohydrolase